MTKDELLAYFYNISFPQLYKYEWKLNKYNHTIFQSYIDSTSI